MSESESKHSPAPWEIVPVDYGDETICLVPAYVKAANGRTVVSRDGGLAPIDDEWTAEEIEANAHLIAAAPEMYEALKAFRTYEQHRRGDCESCDSEAPCEEATDLWDEATRLRDLVLAKVEGRG